MPPSHGGERRAVIDLSLLPRLGNYRILTDHLLAMDKTLTPQE